MFASPATGPASGFDGSLARELSADWAEFDRDASRATARPMTAVNVNRVNAHI
jgi:hypothetical protein